MNSYHDAVATLCVHANQNAASLYAMPKSRFRALYRACVRTWKRKG